MIGTEDGGGDGDPSGADSTGDGGDGASEDPCDVNPALIGGGYEVVLALLRGTTRSARRLG